MHSNASVSISSAKLGHLNSYSELIVLFIIIIDKFINHETSGL